MKLDKTCKLIIVALIIATAIYGCILFSIFKTVYPQEQLFIEETVSDDYDTSIITRTSSNTDSKKDNGSVAKAGEKIKNTLNNKTSKEKHNRKKKSVNFWKKIYNMIFSERK